MSTPPPSQGQAPQKPPALKFLIQSDIATWVLEHGPHIYERTLAATREATRRAIAILLCAGLHLALPTATILGEVCFPVLAGLVACHILTVERLETALGLAIVVGLAEAMLCPSLNLGLLPLVYLVTTLVLRTITDYPTQRTPRDTLIVGATVCMASSIVGCCHAGLSDAAVLLPPDLVAFSILGETLLGSLIVTPLLVAAAVVARRAEIMLWELASAAGTFTAAYFLRHVKPPTST